MTTGIMATFRKASASWYKPSPFTIAVVLVILAQFANAIGVFCMKFSVGEIGSFATALNRFWIAAVVFFIWNQGNAWWVQTAAHKSTAPSDRGAKTDYKTIALFVLSGISWAACLALWGYSLDYTSVANSTLMHDLSPLFATLLGWLFFRHHFDRRFLFAVALTLLGVVVIGFEDFNLGMDRLIGDMLALCSAFFLGLYCLLVGQLRASFSSASIMQWVCCCSALAILPVAMYSASSLLPTSEFGWLAIIGTVILCQVIGQGLTTYSMKNLSSEFVSLFLPLEAVFAATIAWIFFAEQLTLLNDLGFVLLLAGIYIAFFSPASHRYE